MVVGEDQSFGRDDLTGTSSAEMHYGIFQADIVRTIDLVYRDIQTQILHDRRILALQVGEHPHAFIGIRGEGACGKQSS